VRQHQAEFCRAFLLPGRRDRMLTKPDELAGEFYHNLPRALRPSHCLPLPAPVTPQHLLSLLKSLSTSNTAVYLGNGSGEGSYPIATVIDEIACNHSAVASIEPGMLALYATEGCPRADWYLLCTDPERLAKAKRLWQQHKKGP
jgi:hypothetical protein